jgi:hypothetical protein
MTSTDSTATPAGDAGQAPGPGAGQATSGGADTGQAPLVAGDDVRVGPDTSDEPQAGAAEPTD